MSDETDSGQASLTESFYRAMGNVAASVYVITTSDDRGRPSGFTATSVTSLSDDPPSLIFCVDRSNRGAELYETGQRVAAHVLAGDQQHISARFAGQGGEVGEEKFAGVDWHTEDGVPIVEGTSSLLIGEIDAVYDGYTHKISVLRLTHIRVNERRPLLYHNQNYFSPD